MNSSEIDTHLAAILAIHANFGSTDDARRVSQERVSKHQWVLARAYGERRGWQVAEKRFPLSALAPTCGPTDDWPHEFSDHRWFWYHGGRPVAVSAHLYGCDDKRRVAARLWASALGLSVVFPVDFPSWYYPGTTTLIDITRAA